jgi:hypothetical protein
MRSVVPGACLVAGVSYSIQYVSKSSLAVHIHAGNRQGSMMPGRLRLRDVSMPRIDGAWPMPGIDKIF